MKRYNSAGPLSNRERIGEGLRKGERLRRACRGAAGGGKVSAGGASLRGACSRRVMFPLVRQLPARDVLDSSAVDIRKPRSAWLTATALRPPPVASCRESAARPEPRSAQEPPGLAPFRRLFRFSASVDHQMTPALFRPLFRASPSRGLHWRTGCRARLRRPSDLKHHAHCREEGGLGRASGRGRLAAFEL